MSIRIGIIGTGMIGLSHGQRLLAIGGADVAGVADVDADRAAEVAERLGGVRVFGDGHELIASPDVDAVLVTSIGPTHAEFVLATIAAGKPVMCEKPLAPTTDECERIIEAEVAHGKRLVIVGFMRRCDPGYLQVKAAIDAGDIGSPLIVHNVHRTPSLPAPYWTQFMTVTDAMVHEVDVTHWLLGEEISAVQTISPRRTSRVSAEIQDPLIALFTTTSGVVSEVEFFATADYGYDVRCEVVGESGTASLVNPVVAATSAAGRDGSPIPADWRVRFGPAFEVELRSWVDGLARGEIIGPSSWDGYAATRVTEVGVAAARSGDRLPVEYMEKPGLYR